MDTLPSEVLNIFVPDRMEQLAWFKPEWCFVVGLCGHDLFMTTHQVQVRVLISTFGSRSSRIPSQFLIL